MARMQTRRGFLGGIAAAGATSLIRTRWAEAAEGPLENDDRSLSEAWL